MRNCQREYGAPKAAFSSFAIFMFSVPSCFVLGCTAVVVLVLFNIFFEIFQKYKLVQKKKIQEQVSHNMQIPYQSGFFNF